MKTSLVPFAQLRHLLLELGFTEAQKDTYWRFGHPASGTILVFRPYSLAEHVTVQDLAGTRKHLDWRGLLVDAKFEDALTKAPA
jgi:hypothetical protein